MADKEINFEIRTEIDPILQTDAQMAARWASEALAAGRYELGRCLANLAAAAHRAETSVDKRNAAMVGQNRPSPELDRTPTYETVSEPADTLAQPFEGIPGDGDADRDAFQDESDTATAMIPAYAGDAQTEIFGRQPEPRLAVPEGGRCAVEIVHVRGTEKYVEPCGGPIWWNADGSNRDNGTWCHVDPAIDMHHWATPFGPADRAATLEG
jgi:hypothetical protein